MLFYAGQLARRADRRLPVFRNGRAAPPFEQVDNVLTAAHVLSAQLRELGTARAWHPSGLADATGWPAWRSPRSSCTDLMWPRRCISSCPFRRRPVAAPGRLLLAATGRAEVHGVRVDQEWWWQSAPLSQWDGAARRRPPFAGLGVRATTAVQIELNCSHGELAHPSVRD